MALPSQWNGLGIDVVITATTSTTLGLLFFMSMALNEMLSLDFVFSE
jgi:hypothetical protein